MLTTLYSDFKNSIKSPDTEEKLDLILYRPCGYIVAKISHQCSLTPSALSILGLFSGVIAAYYFLMPLSVPALLSASFYFILSGIFDSADGQLARLSNQSTKLGLILDGICDSLVTISIYLACAYPFIKNYGALFIPILILGLYFHAYQCAILDFYHREYLYFGYGKIDDDTYWNPTVSELETRLQSLPFGIEKLLTLLRLSWVKKQNLLTTRSENVRVQMQRALLKSDSRQKKWLTKIYRKSNIRLLPCWRLIGVNAHTIMLILFIAIGRFDLYLLIFDILAFNLIIFIMMKVQANSDQRMLMFYRIANHDQK